MSCCIIQEVGYASVDVVPCGGGMAGGYRADGGDHCAFDGLCVEKEDAEKLLDPLDLFQCHRSSRKGVAVLGLGTVH